MADENNPVLLKLIKIAYSILYFWNRKTWGCLGYFWRWMFDYNKSPIVVNDYYMFVDPENDMGLSRDLMILHRREPHSTDYIGKFLDRSDVVLDIGANIGYYAIMEALKADTIYAIEPVPKNVSQLYKNINLNNLKNVSVFSMAIGDRECNSPIYIYPKLNQCCVNEIVQLGESTGSITVPMTTLDVFVQANGIEPTVARMDVEGYEYKILRGSHETLKHLKKMFIEFHGNILDIKQKKETLNILKDAGFTPEKIFIEPVPLHRGTHRIIAWLESRMGIISEGEYPANYDTLTRLLDADRVCRVFLVKNNEVK
jgi:FkbM family methyltransferase